MFAGGSVTRSLVFVGIVLLGGLFVYSFRNEEKRPMPAPPKEISASSELATLGGGCFWCVEAVFEELKGVERVQSGYTGGSTENPTYEEICTGLTNHAEVVQVAFDPKVISYREILEIFFAFHDPSTLNCQGADRGTQYRSAIFYHSPEQKQIAEALIAELDPQKIWPGPIVTQVAPLEKFYVAEPYHQGYFRANPYDGYCQRAAAPKLAKLRKHYASKLKSQ